MMIAGIEIRTSEANADIEYTDEANKILVLEIPCFSIGVVK
jgi:hypothetical protein